MKKFLIFLVVALMGFKFTQAQNIAEILGYDKNSKLLIMHADDLGLAHSVNESSIQALENGGISSASIMVPCPWFSEIAEYARNHPEYCWGLHLTLTSEWKYYKWGGVSSKDKTKSLYNAEGYFYDNVREVASIATVNDIYQELKAQIDKALNAGIPVSHLDTHMGTLFAKPEYFEAYLNLGKEYNLPVMIPAKELIPPSSKLDSLFGPIQYSLDNLLMLGKIEENWQDVYNGMIEKLVPGLNQIIVHLAFDNDEMKAIMIDHPSFGSEWRQKDFEYVLSESYRKKLQENEVILVSWKEVREALMKKN